MGWADGLSATTALRHGLRGLCGRDEHPQHVAGHCRVSVTRVENIGVALLVIAPLTLFVVLYRLDLVDAAGRGQRGGAWRSPLCVVAAAVLVYDLGAHFGDALARRVVAQRRAPAVRAWRGRRRGAVWTRKAGLGHDALIGCAVVEARNSTEQTQTQTEAAVAGVFSGGVWPKGGRRTKRQWQQWWQWAAALYCVQHARCRQEQIGDMCGREWSQRPKGIGMLFIMEPFCVPDRRYFWTRC